jgi:hypothetical protein
MWQEAPRAPRAEVRRSNLRPPCRMLPSHVQRVTRAAPRRAWSSRREPGHSAMLPSQRKAFSPPACLHATIPTCLHRLVHPEACLAVRRSHVSSSCCMRWLAVLRVIMKAAKREFGLGHLATEGVGCTSRDRRGRSSRTAARSGTTAAEATTQPLRAGGPTMTARRLLALMRMRVRLPATLAGCVLSIVACSSSSLGTGPDDGGSRSDGGACGTTACGAGELCCPSDPCSSAMACTQPFRLGGGCPPLPSYACDASARVDSSPSVTCGTTACGAGELCCRTDPCSSAMGCTQPLMGGCPPLASYACEAGAPYDGSADALNDASTD